LGALVGEKTLVDLRPVSGGGKFGVLVAQDDPLAGGQAAQAFVPRGRGQPGTDSIWVLDTIDVLEQSQPGGLGYVRGVALDQLELHRDRPYEPGILSNKPLPGVPVPFGRTSHQACDIRGIEALLQRRHVPSPLSKNARQPPCPQLCGGVANSA